MNHKVAKHEFNNLSQAEKQRAFELLTKETDYQEKSRFNWRIEHEYKQKWRLENPAHGVFLQRINELSEEYRDMDYRGYRMHPKYVELQARIKELLFSRGSEYELNDLYRQQDRVKKECVIDWLKHRITIPSGTDCLPKYFPSDRLNPYVLTSPCGCQYEYKKEHWYNTREMTGGGGYIAARERAPDACYQKFCWFHRLWADNSLLPKHSNSYFRDFCSLALRDMELYSKVEVHTHDLHGHSYYSC